MKVTPRTHFKKAICALTLVALAAANMNAATESADGELLYNGIRLPKQWPPMTPIKGRAVKPVPYLTNPPPVIPIDVGRQMFMDDFLIEKSTLQRKFHYPEKFAGNPILKPETPTELNNGKFPVAAMISDGVCYDPFAREFKMWYHAGWRDGTMLATSKDGLKWTRPETDIEPGNNRVLPKQTKFVRHGTSICIDPYTSDVSQRFKMLIFGDDTRKTSVYTAPDGVHWTFKDFLPECGDNTTMFYNPFRKKWVYSIRLYRNGRARNYIECDDFLAGMHWDKEKESPWENTDELDTVDKSVLALMPSAEEIAKESATTNKTVAELTEYYRNLYGDPPAVYNLDAIPYESVMVGMFGIVRGPMASKAWNKTHTVKFNDLLVAYSRDGFHWDRPDRTPFLASTHKDGDWEKGYLHAGVGICTVVGDKLYFYYSGWSGEAPKGKDTYAGGSTGVAFLRRDGFASMNAESEGALTTRPVTFKGKHMFVNVVAPKGELKVEVLDEQGKVIAPFSKENSVAIRTDSTKQAVQWKGADDLSKLSGQKVRFRFTLKQGELYSFWVSPDVNGASHGYVASGGPDFPSTMDTVGK